MSMWQRLHRINTTDPDDRYKAETLILAGDPCPARRFLIEYYARAVGCGKDLPEHVKGYEREVRQGLPAVVPLPAPEPQPSDIEPTESPETADPPSTGTIAPPDSDLEADLENMTFEFDTDVDDV